MANLYYAEQLAADRFAPGEHIEITGDEARHAVRVARLRVGEQILVGNAAGVMGSGEVIAADRDRCVVRLVDAHEVPRADWPITLVQALAKGDRDERAVEQATEFGVDAIVPWQAERSVSRWDGAEKATRGRAKWQRIAREASKQALRARVPVVGSLTTLDELCSMAQSGSTLLVLHPEAGTPLSRYAQETLAHRTAGGITVVIGPEGGIADGELAALERAGAVSLRLGATVLRTSSAGPATLAVLNAALGVW